MSQEYKADVLYLHLFIRKLGRYVPNLSPFAIKVETWLRANNIKHEVVETRISSRSTGQIPYLIYNGKEIPDSNRIIDFISDVEGVAIDDWLTKEQKAVSRGFTRMLDEGTSWTYLLHRYCYNKEEFAKYCQMPIGRLNAEEMKTQWKDRADKHGVGRQSVEDMNKIAAKDLQALSDYLGDKSFIHGHKLSLIDCAVFGHLCQIVYVPFPYPQTAYMRAHCTNLFTYLDRIRDTCWPDWNAIVISEPFDNV